MKRLIAAREAYISSLDPADIQILLLMLWTISVVFAASITLRLGLVDFRAGYLQVALFGAAAFCLPVLLKALFALQLRTVALPFLSVLSFALLVFLQPPPLLSAGIVAVTCLIAGDVLWQTRKGLGIGTLYFIALSLLVAADIALTVHAFRRVDALSFERALHGLESPDAVSDAALGVISYLHRSISLGFDGFLSRSYHAFALIWIGCLSDMTRLPPIVAFAAASNMIFFPALILAATQLAVTLMRLGSQTFRVATVLALIYLGVKAMLIWEWPSFVYVPTYSFPVAIFLLGCAWLADPPRWRPYAVLAANLLILGVLTSGKVSLGFAYLLTLLFFILRNQSASLAQKLTHAGVYSVWAALLYKLFAPQGSSLSSRISLFSFIENHHDGNYFFYLLHHLFPLVALVLLFSLRRARKAQTASPSSWISDPLLILCLTLACTLPGVLLNVDGGSDWYFSNIPTWLALPIAVAAMHEIAHRYGGELRSKLLAKTSLTFQRGIRMSALAIAAGGIFFWGMDVHKRTTRTAQERLKRDVKSLRMAGYGSFFDADGNPSLRLMARHFAALSQSPAIDVHTKKRRREYRTVTYDIYKKVGKLKARDKAGLGLFISSDETKYWGAPFGMRLSMTTVQALTGMPQLLGMPASASPDWEKENHASVHVFYRDCAELSSPLEPIKRILFPLDTLAARCLTDPYLLSQVLALRASVDAQSTTLASAAKSRGFKRLLIVRANASDRFKLQHVR